MLAVGITGTAQRHTAQRQQGGGTMAAALIATIRALTDYSHFIDAELSPSLRTISARDSDHMVGAHHPQHPAVRQTRRDSRLFLGERQYDSGQR